MIEKVTGGIPQIQSLNAKTENSEQSIGSIKQIQRLVQQKEDIQQEPVQKRSFKLLLIV